LSGYDPVKIDKYKKDLERLIKNGDGLYAAMLLSTVPIDQRKRLGVTEAQIKEMPDVRKEYQTWYSEALSCVRHLLPDRLDDFVGYYKPSKNRKTIDASTYTISDYLHGLESSLGDIKIVTPAAARPLFQQQLQIVRALSTRFESTLFDIRTLVQADFFDDELSAADELNGKGFSRAAGAVAGVVLEEHLGAISQQHKIPTGKSPTISEMNDLLKKNEITDMPTWRFVQRLGDLRNLCDHKKKEEPTKENVAELIEGVRKIIKTVF
jgi:hypothetical protein